MGRTFPRLPSFHFNGVGNRAWDCSLPVESKPIRTDEAVELGEMQSDGDWKASYGRRIMVVVDSGLEAKGALQWALSHTIQIHDNVLLLHVIKPSKHGEDMKTRLSPKDYELLFTMKNMCHTRLPELQVEVALVEGKEKGPTIVEEARKQGVSLLVLGQRKGRLMWPLLKMCFPARVECSLVDYCINNADCMTLAVRRKSRKLGGYLITTRRHKDFWLLA